MKIIPRKNQVLVKPDPKESRISKHGLIIPSNVEQEQRAIGLVIATGPEIKDIKKGDKVIYGVYAGDRIKINENDKEVEYIILFDEDILAFIK